IAIHFTSNRLGQPRKVSLTSTARTLTQCLVREGSLVFGECPLARPTIPASWREAVESALSALRHPEAFLLPPPSDVGLDDLLAVRECLVCDSGDVDPAKDAGNRIASRVAGTQPREALTDALRHLLGRLTTAIDTEVNAGRTWAAEQRHRQPLQDRVIAGL